MIGTLRTRKLMLRARRAFRRGGDLRTRFFNIGHLLTGNLLSSLLALAAVALSARALGPVDYGYLALVYAFTRVVEKIVSFQSWQPIIKYGAHLQGPERRDDLRKLLKFGFLLDLGAAVGAWLVAVLAALLAAPLFGWPASTIHLIILYSTVLLFQLSGMPTAVLRMAGNFRLIAYGQLVNLILRLALCFWGALHSFGIEYFAAVWAGTQILGSLITLFLAMLVLRRQGIRGILSARLRGVTQRFPDIWHFAWSANLSLTLRTSSHELDMLVVGALTDPASAGLYHIAKRVGRIGQQVGAQVQAVVYPDVARLWAAGQIEDFKRVVLQVEVILFASGMLGAVVVAAIVHPLLVWTAGPAFLAAAPLIIVQMVAAALDLSGSAARVALLAMGRQRQVLAVVAIATATFHVTAFLLVPAIGPMGANVAHVVLGAIWATCLGLSLHRALGAYRHASGASASELTDCPGEAGLLASKGT